MKSFCAKFAAAVIFLLCQNVLAFGKPQSNPGHVEVVESGLWFNGKERANLTVGLKSEVKLTAVVKASERPRKDRFAFAINARVMQRNFEAEVFNLFQGNLYLVSVKLTPSVSGDYQMVGLDPRTASAKSFRIEVNCEHFQDNIRLQRSEVAIGEMVLFKTTVCYPRLPLTRDLEIYSVNSNPKVKDDIIDNLHIARSRVQAVDADQAALSLPTFYEVEVGFYIQENGTFQFGVVCDEIMCKSPRFEALVFAPIAMEPKSFSFVNLLFGIMKFLLYSTVLAFSVELVMNFFLMGDRSISAVQGAYYRIAVTQLLFWGNSPSVWSYFMNGIVWAHPFSFGFVALIFAWGALFG